MQCILVYYVLCQLSHSHASRLSVDSDGSNVVADAAAAAAVNSCDADKSSNDGPTTSRTVSRNVH
jgi:hypothetical protein